MKRIEFVPDGDIEIYFKAADVVVLPYVYIFQSGVIFLSYYFGLPVIATDVASLLDYVVEGKTGFVCKPRDPIDLANCIETTFPASYTPSWKCVGARSRNSATGGIPGR